MNYLDPVRNLIKLQVRKAGVLPMVPEIDLASLEDALKLPDPETDGDFNLVLYNVEDYPDPSDDPQVEIIRVTKIDGTTLTVERGQEGTTPIEIVATKQYNVLLAPTKKLIDDIDNFLGQAQTAFTTFADDLNSLEDRVGDAEVLLSSLSTQVGNHQTLLQDLGAVDDYSMLFIQGGTIRTSGTIKTNTEGDLEITSGLLLVDKDDFTIAEGQIKRSMHDILVDASDTATGTDIADSSYVGLRIRYRWTSEFDISSPSDVFGGQGSAIALFELDSTATVSEVSSLVGAISASDGVIDKGTGVFSALVNTGGEITEFNAFRAETFVMAGSVPTVYFARIEPGALNGDVNWGLYFEQNVPSYHAGSFDAGSYLSGSWLSIQSSNVKHNTNLTDATVIESRSDDLLDLGFGLKGYAKLYINHTTPDINTGILAGDLSPLGFAGDTIIFGVNDFSDLEDQVQANTIYNGDITGNSARVLTSARISDGSGFQTDLTNSGFGVSSTTGVKFVVSELVTTLLNQAQFSDGSVSDPAISWLSDSDTGFTWLSSGITQYIGNGTSRFNFNTLGITSTGSGFHIARNTSELLPTYSFVGRTGDGMYSIASGELGWSLNGVKALSLDSVGLGIGTPAVEKLTVSGSIRVLGGGFGIDAVANPGFVNVPLAGGYQIGSSSVVYTSGTYTILRGHSTTARLGLGAMGSATDMVIYNDGSNFKVGIGSVTPTLGRFESRWDSGAQIIASYSSLIYTALETLSTGAFKIAPTSANVLIQGTTSFNPRIEMENIRTVQYSTTGFTLRNTETADGYQEWHFVAQKDASGAATGDSQFYIRLRNSSQTEAFTPFSIDGGTGDINLLRGFSTGTVLSYGDLLVGSTANNTAKVSIGDATQAQLGLNYSAGIRTTLQTDSSGHLQITPNTGEVVVNSLFGVGITPTTLFHMSGSAPVFTVNDTSANSGLRINVTGLDADGDTLVRFQDAGSTVFTMYRDGDAEFIKNVKITNAAEQLRLGWSALIYSSIYTDATGNLIVSQTGAGLRATGTIAIDATPVGAYKFMTSGGSSTARWWLSNTSGGHSAWANDMPGIELTAGTMNTTTKYTPAIKFGSIDGDLATTNPKFNAGIAGRATQAYSSDNATAMAMDFFVSDTNGGAGSVAQMRMTLEYNKLQLEHGILSIKETTTPTADADYGKVYTKADNKLYFQDGAGTEHEIQFV